MVPSMTGGCNSFLKASEALNRSRRQANMKRISNASSLLSFLQGNLFKEENLTDTQTQETVEHKALSAVFVKQSKMSPLMKGFFDFLNFSEIGDGKYLMLIHTDIEYDMVQLRHFFKMDCLKLLTQLEEQEYIKLDYTNCDKVYDNSMPKHFKYISEGLVFTLTKKFFNDFLSSKKEENSFSLKKLNSEGDDNNMGKFHNVA